MAQLWALFNDTIAIASFMPMNGMLKSFFSGLCCNIHGSFVGVLQWCHFYWGYYSLNKINCLKKSTYVFVYVLSHTETSLFVRPKLSKIKRFFTLKSYFFTYVTSSEYKDFTTEEHCNYLYFSTFLNALYPKMNLSNLLQSSPMWVLGGKILSGKFRF